MNIENLNSKQKEAVLHKEGPMLVLAGAGSGKTKVLTSRIANLIETGTSPANILAITFTNKAAREMKERVAKLIGFDANYIQISTFHSLGLKIIKENYEFLGYERNFIILDSDDTLTIIKKLMKDLNMNPKYYNARELRNKISSAKNELIDPSHFSKIEFDNKIVTLYKKYQEKLKQGNSVDFDDLLILPIKLFKISPNILNSYQERYKYILIDEYQDISEDRYILAKNVSTVNTAKVVAVGDDWQSIFSFAGSKIEYTYNFLSYFPTAKILKISKAYRNSRQLIKYSSDFIMKNTDQISKQLLSTKENPSPIKFVFFEEGKEYQKLKELILAIHKNNKNSHILILGRTNKIIDTMYEEPELIDDIETKVKYQGYDDIDIDGMTIHKSKGLTSDEVIIIGLDSRFPKPYYGDFWLKEIYKNNWYEEKIPFAEERRLFYVALTRTKNNVYLLVNKDADNRSPFINEIYNIMINNKESI